MTTVTTVYTTIMQKMDVGAPRPAVQVTFATEAERDAFVAKYKAQGWRPQSLSTLTIVTADQADALVAAATAHPTSPGN